MYNLFLIQPFEDLVASKMVALVEWGAPRDFLDIYHLCKKGLVTIAECWQLWRERQNLARENTDTRRAIIAI
ncbi:MAG: nucleotidyl transferase AbiEii/AbiGii toxin family protein [Anaerolineales bacterium]